MFAGDSSNNNSNVNWYVGGSNVGNDNNNHGNLCSGGYVPTSGGTLTKYKDHRDHNSGSYGYDWYVKVGP